MRCVVFSWTSHQGSDKVIHRKAVWVTACTQDICRLSDVPSAWMLVDRKRWACSQHRDAAASLHNVVDRASGRKAMRHWQNVIMSRRTHPKLDTAPWFPLQSAHNHVPLSFWP